MSAAVIAPCGRCTLRVVVGGPHDCGRWGRADRTVAGTNGQRNRDRAEWFARAEFFAWDARRAVTGLTVPLGNDPIGGQPWNPWKDTARRLGLVSNAALARECYRIARAFPNPLPTAARVA